MESNKVLNIICNNILLGFYCNVFSNSADSYFLGLCTDAQKWERGKEKEGEGETEIAFFGWTLAPTNIAQNRRTTQKIGGQNRRREESKIKACLRTNGTTVVRALK